MPNVDPNLDSNQWAYNKFSLLSQMSYNICSYLMDNDEFIWRLLKYTTADAWNSSVRADLSKAEKGALIWNGEGNQIDHRVFFDVGQDQSWTTAATMLRISPAEVVPTNHIYGNSAIAFEVYSHYSLSTMTNYATRNVSIIQRLIEVLNGADIEGVGRLYFNARASSRCRVGVIGSIPYKGMSMVMCSNALG